MGYNAVCHLAITKALSLAGAGLRLERSIFNTFSVLFSNFMSLLIKMLNDQALLILVYKTVIEFWRKYLLSMPFMPLFMHFTVSISS